jgi:hypothetical protein
MISRLFSGLTIFAALFLAACAPVQQAPTGTSWPAPPTSQKPAPEPQPSRPHVQTEPQKSGVTHPAVTSLVDQGWNYYRQDNYEAALSVAERAQRIDARSPEVYLLMASAQFSLYQLSVAEQLTRRGLAFAGADTAVGRKLQALLGKILSSK